MPYKILVIDDEPDITNLAKLVLEKKGYQVTTASGGDEALHRADAEIPDLILLDVVMPGKSGFEVCKILKAQVKTRHIPVVLFTALGRDVDKKLGKEAGAEGYFTKPFTPESLVAEVDRYLSQARTDKFSRQLGVEHGKLKGKKILFEFDPATPYERLIRDFAMESISDNEAVIVLTKKGSAVLQTLEGEKGVEFFDAAVDLMLSPLIERHGDRSISLIYDNLTDLVLLVGSQTTYKFVGNAMELLSEPRITAMFLLNPHAHDPKEAYSLRALFSSQIAYGKQGITTVKIA